MSIAHIVDFKRIRRGESTAVKLEGRRDLLRFYLRVIGPAQKKCRLSNFF